MSNLGSFIWSIADQLRGPYRPNQYGNVILPLTILRRLDCILEPDLETVRALAAEYDNPNKLKVKVEQATGRPFYNTSNYVFRHLRQATRRCSGSARFDSDRAEGAGCVRRRGPSSGTGQARLQPRVSGARLLLDRPLVAEFAQVLREA